MWESLDYLVEAEKQLNDSNLNTDVNCQRKTRQNQLKRAAVFLKGLKRK